MGDIVRGVGYTGSFQQLQWTGDPVQVQVYLWGGGGGGGGAVLNLYNPLPAGGNATGGSYSESRFSLSNGDILQVAVGQGGAPGSRGTYYYASGGLGGQSLLFDLFDSRDAVGSVAVSDPRWSPFMNAHAVWGASAGATYSYSQTINFPYTGQYSFTYAADDAATIYLDGAEVISFSGFQDDPPRDIGVTVTAGNHTVSWLADNSGGDVRGMALTITAAFCGGNGSAAGGDVAGGGGGGGGATALYKNSELIAVAGGGGGGGGSDALNNEFPDPNAPGPNGVTLDGVFAGQNGQRSFAPGGGSGGGGGGYAGGQGGSHRGGLSGEGGTPGRGLGLVIVDANNRAAAASSNEYYSGSSRGGYGGFWTGGTYTPATAGQNGYAVFVFQSPGVFVRDAGVWKAVQTIYVRQNNTWQQATGVNIRDAGSWIQARGANPPTFVLATGTYGRAPRSNPDL